MGFAAFLQNANVQALSPSHGEALLPGWTALERYQLHEFTACLLTTGASLIVTSMPVQKVFVDPILAHDGTTFERSALLEYLKTSTISPTTGVDLGKNPTLVQNRSIKSAIEHLSR